MAANHPNSNNNNNNNDNLNTVINTTTVVTAALPNQSERMSTRPQWQLFGTFTVSHVTVVKCNAQQ